MWFLSIPFMKIILMIFIMLQKNSILILRKLFNLKNTYINLYTHIIQQNPNIQMYKLVSIFWTKFISLQILSMNKNDIKVQGKFSLFLLSASNFFFTFHLFNRLSELIVMLGENKPSSTYGQNSVF